MQNNNIQEDLESNQLCAGSSPVHVDPTQTSALRLLHLTVQTGPSGRVKAPM